LPLRESERNSLEVYALIVAAIQSNKSTARTDLFAIFLRAHQIKVDYQLILQVFCTVKVAVVNFELLQDLFIPVLIYQLSLADIVKNKMSIYNIIFIFQTVYGTEAEHDDRKI
jgi:hypothetical protein